MLINSCLISVCVRIQHSSLRCMRAVSVLLRAPFCRIAVRKSLARGFNRSLSLSMSSAGSASAVPAPDAAVWHALDSTAFRHAKLRAAELPSRFLHVAMQRDESAADGGAPVRAEDVYRVFAAFGEVEGVRMLPPPHTPKQPEQRAASAAAAAAHPQQPLRQFAYVAFRVKQHAAHALLTLHQKSSPLLPGIRMQVHHAIERTDDRGTEQHGASSAAASSDVAAAAAACASASASAASASPSSSAVPPQGLRMVVSFLSPAECTRLRSLVAELASHKKGSSTRSFGAALPEEDDRFGLKKPAMLDTEAWGEVMKRVEKAAASVDAALDAAACVGSAAAPAASSASADAGGAPAASSSFPSAASPPHPFNRASLSLLRPGQGIKRGRDAPHLFGESVALLNLGESHVVLEVAHPARGGSKSKEAWGLLVLPGSLVLLTGAARAEFEYGISARTRDVLPAKFGEEPFLLPAGADPPPGAVNMKRGETTLAFLRHVRPEPLPAPATVAATEGDQELSAAQKKLAAKEARARAQDDDEKREKKVHSTAMRVPGSSSAAGGASSSVLSSAEEAEQAAAAMESLHVTGVYDSIAAHFSSTRHSPWPRIESFVLSIPPGSIVADVGCGNGKYMGLNKSLGSIRGCDASQRLVDIARGEKGYDVIQGDLMNVPFESGHFDAVLCIAVLHHISTLDRRRRGARELVRLLRPGGKLLVSAWALEQDSTSRRAFPAQDVLVPWTIPKRIVEADPKALEVAASTAEAQVRAAAEAQGAEAGAPATAAEASSSSDSTATLATAASLSPSPSPSPSSLVSFIDPSSGSELVQFQRYCHVYVEGELEALFTDQFSPDQVRVVEQYYDRGNWCVVVQKVQ